MIKTKVDYNFINGHFENILIFPRKLGFTFHTIKLSSNDNEENIPKHLQELLLSFLSAIMLFG